MTTALVPPGPMSLAAVARRTRNPTWPDRVGSTTSRRKLAQLAVLLSEVIFRRPVVPAPALAANGFLVRRTGSSLRWRTLLRTLS